MKENESTPTTHKHSQDISVLVVDDHQGMLQSMGAILEDEGYQVSLAGSGYEVIEICQKQSFDVILMDVRMPGLDGLETVQRIKDYVKNTRIVMMSAYSVEEVKKKALQEGVVAFLQKPIDVEMVIKLIQQVEQPSILLMLEDKNERQVLVNYFSQHNYYAHTTKFSQEVVDLARQVCFSVIIIDANMTTGDGLELYQDLEKATPTTLFILLYESCNNFPDIGTETVQKSIPIALEKPLDIDRFLSILKTHTK